MMYKHIHSALKGYEKIIVVGGGTGGHISPIVSLVRTYKNSQKIFLWIGGKNSQEEKIAKQENISFKPISVLKLSTTKSPKIFLYPFFWGKTFFQAYNILKKSQEDSKNIAIFSKGGPGSLAICMAGRALGIPVFIHESDTIPGRSNRLVGKFAEKIFLGFQSAEHFFPKGKCVVIGQMLDEILLFPSEKQKIFWKTSKKHILVLCGSQGAKSVFEEIVRNCSDFDVEWIIVLGTLNADMREVFKNFPHIQILDWLEKDQQNGVFRETDFAITRGSATTLAELELFKIPKIIIPLPTSASNHQYYNAKEYEKSGDIVLEQQHLRKLREKIEILKSFDSRQGI